MNRADLDAFRIDIQFLKESLSKLLAEEEYLTVDEAAQFLKVSYHMMYDKRFQTKIPHIEVNSIEEISLNKAAKILHRSTRFITYEVQAGRLKAIKYRDKSRRLRYRLRLSDIKEYQKTRETRDLKLEYSGPTTEEICNSIFNNNRKVQ